MTCGFCGCVIDEDEARRSCSSCPMAREGCRRIKCTTCGYENPETPAFIQWLARVLSSRHWTTKEV